MCSFIKKIWLLGIIIGSLLCAITYINWAFINYSSFFVLSKNVNVLILGDSHTKYSFNDNIIRNSCNFSTDADSYFYSYLKLKELKKKNNQIDTLLLSFSQHNIDECIESRWLLNSSHLHSRLKYYYPLFDKKDIGFMLTQKPKDLFSNLFSQILNPLYFILNGQSIYGGYAPLGHNILEQEINKQKENKTYQESKFISSTIEKQYLEKIKDYCAQNRIKLIFVNPPLHKLINNKQENLYSFYKTYFSDVLFLDFSKLEMSDDCYGDLVHLSPKGSNYFSKLIEKTGLLNLAKSTNAQQ